MDLMPEVESDEEQINTIQEQLNSDATGEENPNFVYKNKEDAFKGDEEIINQEITDELVIEEKIKLTKQEIFDIPDAPNTSKPPKKKRKPMTEEHKQKLALARDKALATRRRNAEEKRQMKDLEKKAKQKKMKDLENYVNQDKPIQKEEPVKHVPVVAPVKERIVEPTFTKKDLEDAQMNAIMNYEKIRKSRKKEKEQEKMVEKQEEKVKQDLRRAMQPKQSFYGQEDYFDNCF